MEFLHFTLGAAPPPPSIDVRINVTRVQHVNITQYSAGCRVRMRDRLTPNLQWVEIVHAERKRTNGTFFGSVCTSAASIKTEGCCVLCVSVASRFIFLELYKNARTRADV